MKIMLKVVFWRLYINFIINDSISILIIVFLKVLKVYMEGSNKVIYMILKIILINVIIKCRLRLYWLNMIWVVRFKFNIIEFIKRIKEI